MILARQLVVRDGLEMGVFLTTFLQISLRHSVNPDNRFSYAHYSGRILQGMACPINRVIAPPGPTHHPIWFRIE